MPESVQRRSVGAGLVADEREAPAEHAGRAQVVMLDVLGEDPTAERLGCDPLSPVGFEPLPQHRRRRMTLAIGQIDDLLHASITES